METSYLNAIADYGASLITHIGLVDEAGNELTGGSYARKPVTWTSASSGTIRPNSDITFDVPAGATVGGWRGYSALTSGTNYGGGDLTNETYAADGKYNLIAVSTGILHTSS